MRYDPKFMARALELASRGRGNTSPNPMVGAVITDADGRIIGEGYHRKIGEAHAEVNAINSVKDKVLLRDATMYVTLEPCSHYGKTPPCAKLIIDTGIPRVVVGAGDPFKEVAGRGIKMLRNAGIEVVEGVLADESRTLNAVFMTAHENKRPAITLKWAQSSDRYMDSTRCNGHPARFSTPLTALTTHRLRSLNDAILVGSGTVLADKPRLDCRLWPGRSPQPIILDRRRRISQGSTAMPVAPLIISHYKDLESLLSELYKEGITSILVEGGSQILQSFIDSGLWDIARVETAPVTLGAAGTVKAPLIDRRPSHTDTLDGNRFDIYVKNPLFSVKNL